MSSLKNSYTTPKQAKTKYYPFTKKRLDLNLDRTADSNSPYTRSGFANIDKAIKSADKTILPNVVEGIVLLAPDEPIKYTIKSNNQNKENCSRESYEGYCIWVRTPYDQSTLADPTDILNNLIESDKFLTPDLKVQLQLQYLDRIHAHGMYAPINKEQRKPIIGEHVKIHFYNSNKDSGEIVKGFYEIISNDNATFNLPSPEQQQTIQEVIYGEEDALIIEVTDKETPKPSQIPKNSNNYKTSYPEFEFTEPAPPRDIVPIRQIVSLLSSNYSEEIAIGTFAVMWAEAAKENSTSESGTFISPGGNNFGGVQTDSGRWSAPGIIGQYSKIDSGKKRRSFAIFENPQAFLAFLSNRITAKGMNTLNAEIWTQNYINRWWSPADKSSYTKGTTTFNNKKAIYNTAVRIYKKFLNTTT